MDALHLLGIFTRPLQDGHLSHGVRLLCDMGGMGGVESAFTPNSRTEVLGTSLVEAFARLNLQAVLSDSSCGAYICRRTCSTPNVHL